MAEEENGGSEPKKKKSPLLFIIIGVAVLLLGGGGFVAYTMFFKSPAPAPDAAAPEAAKPAASFGKVYKLDTFVVNLSDPGGKRYLKTRIELEFINPEVEEELNGRLPQIRDVVLLLLSSKTLEDVQGVEGKIALRNELLMRINQILKTGKLKNLYFTEFIVQ